MKGKNIYISTLCIKFEDYPWLKNCLDAFHDFPVGVEHGTWWDLQPELPDVLDKNKAMFYGMPTTIHAPFHEICNEPGSARARTGSSPWTAPAWPHAVPPGKKTRWCA